jgi:hypothetical protein
MNTPPPQPREPGTIAAEANLKSWETPTARRLARRTRLLTARIRALELDNDPNDSVVLQMTDLSFLVSSLACANVMLDECRKSRSLLLQTFALARQN